MHSCPHSARSNVSMFCGFNTRAWDGHDGRLVGASYDVGGMVFAWVLWTSEVVSWDYILHMHTHECCRGECVLCGFTPEEHKRVTHSKGVSVVDTSAHSSPPLGGVGECVFACGCVSLPSCHIHSLSHRHYVYILHVRRYCTHGWATRTHREKMTAATCEWCEMVINTTETTSARTWSNFPWDGTFLTGLACLSNIAEGTQSVRCKMRSAILSVQFSKCEIAAHYENETRLTTETHEEIALQHSWQLIHLFLTLSNWKITVPNAARGSTRACTRTNINMSTLKYVILIWYHFYNTSKSS